MTHTPWSDIEFRRLEFRMALFQRRGFPEDAAGELAARLVDRDRDLDERRMCIECENLQQSGTCFSAAQGWMTGVSRGLTPIRTLMQRCDFFKWVKP
jgi:hypothetical protein